MLGRKLVGCDLLPSASLARAFQAPAPHLLSRSTPTLCCDTCCCCPAGCSSPHRMTCRSMHTTAHCHHTVPHPTRRRVRPLPTNTHLGQQHETLLLCWRQHPHRTCSSTHIQPAVHPLTTHTHLGLRHARLLPCWRYHPHRTACSSGETHTGLQTATSPCLARGRTPRTPTLGSGMCACSIVSCSPVAMSTATATARAFGGRRDRDTPGGSDVQLHGSVSVCTQRQDNASSQSKGLGTSY